MEDCTDYTTPQSSIFSGCTETQEDNGLQYRETQTSRKCHTTTELHSTGRSGPTSRKHCAKQHLPNKRLPHKTPKRSAGSSQSTSSSSSQCTTSSDDSSDNKDRRAERREEQARAKHKQKNCTIYVNWIQETSKQCKKELQKYKVTNWVNGQRSRQFGMAGHVIRKKDGRWSNALLRWNEGKAQGHNTTTLYWEHDIEVWIKQRFPDDHRTWQQLALNVEQWTKLRNQYAEDWPNNQFTRINHKRKYKKDQSNIIITGELQTTSIPQGKVVGTDKQKEAAQSRLIPTPGKTRIITIVLRSASHKETEV